MWMQFDISNQKVPCHAACWLCVLMSFIVCIITSLGNLQKIIPTFSLLFPESDSWKICIYMCPIFICIGRKKTNLRAKIARRLFVAS